MYLEDTVKTTCKVQTEHQKGENGDLNVFEHWIVVVAKHACLSISEPLIC